MRCSPKFRPQGVRACALTVRVCPGAGAAAGASKNATDALIRNALIGMDVEEEVAAVAPSPEETEREVDAMIQTMTGRRSEFPDFSQPPPEESEAVVEEYAEAEEEAVLEVVDGEQAADKGTDTGEYQTRLKLVWVIIAIVVLGLLAFVLARQLRTSDSSSEPTPTSTVPEQSMNAEPVEPTDADEADSSQLAQESETGGDSEEQLRRELEAQRRQLQEEIVESQNDDNEGDG